MIFIIRNFIKNDHGSALILVSLAFIVLLGITGLVIDSGMLYVSKAHLQKTANAAALSGSQELLSGTSAVSNIVNEILIFHQEENSLLDLTIVEKQKITVSLKKEVPLSFLKIFGFNSSPVGVTATALLGQLTRVQGAVPLGIDGSVPLVFNTEYQLKVDSGDSDTGFFGILALAGPGANLYEDNLRYGFDGEIKIGDIIETQTGNIETPTREAINDRINRCPYGSMDLNHRDCPRVVLVPVYEPYDQTSNQLKAVKIVGFAYFYILEPLDSHDSSITGMFIKRVGPGFGDVNQSDFGAYSAKLVK